MSEGSFTVNKANTTKHDCRLRRIFIGLGSNLGDREMNLKTALQLLERRKIIVLRVSSLYETEPIEVSEIQPLYLNVVAEIQTDLPIVDLMVFLDQIERRLGRTDKGNKRARIIDLDILWANGERIRTDGLTLPHPRLWDRAFVLIPLSELVKELDGISVHEKAKQLAKQQKVKLIKSQWYP